MAETNQHRPRGKTEETSNKKRRLPEGKAAFCSIMTR
jgi:hypothetical protein